MCPKRGRERDREKEWLGGWRYPNVCVPSLLLLSDSFFVLDSLLVESGKVVVVIVFEPKANKPIIRVCERATK